METNKKNNSSIGIFDSGIGGLTVMQQIMHLLPDENIIYFGDTARVPYGEKSPETIIRYSIENAIFLMEKNIKLLVVACNTASAYALDKLKRIFNVPVIGVIEPGAQQAAEISKNQRIAILGTKGTIHSKVYEMELRRLLPGATLFPIACPLFVPLIEEQFVHHRAMELIVEEYLKPLRGCEIDTVLLGCTHYPLVRDLIQQEMGPHIAIVDSAKTCARAVKSLLDAHGLQAGINSIPEYRYWVSDDPGRFHKKGSDFLGHTISQVELV